MFDQKYLDNTYSPADQLMISLGLHPDQQEAQQRVVDAIQGNSSDLATGANAKQDTEDRMPRTPMSRPSAPVPAQQAQPAQSADSGSPIPIARPGSSSQRAITIPGVSDGPAKLAADQTEVQRLQDTGSGISQIKRKPLRILARIADVAGSALFPTIAENIPGTQFHHQVLQNEAQSRVGTDLAEEEKGLTLQHQNLENANLENPPDKTGDTPEEKTIHDLMAGENGNPRINPDTNKPYQYLEAYQTVKQAADSKDAFQLWKKQNPGASVADWLKLQQDNKNTKQSTEDQYIEEYRKTNPGSSIADAVKAYASDTQKPERLPKQMVIGPDGTAIELRPGVKVPQGTQTVSEDLKVGKPSTDEQRRADLTENLNENLTQLEDIVRRRPELFGKVAGRMTKAKEFIGSDDPDVAALKGIEDRLGMVAQSSHGMRSAQHVEAAANSILNGYKNGPDAMLRSIADARNSSKTFTDDAARASGKQPQAKVIPYSANGKTYNIPEDQEKEFLKDHPKAQKL
ncbi:MAG TPA: hypothetical protein VGK24_05830 [Candidatus Angelobacter sp.]|jgi:hypothetical protein